MKVINVFLLGHHLDPAGDEGSGGLPLDDQGDQGEHHARDDKLHRPPLSNNQSLHLRREGGKNFRTSSRPTDWRQRRSRCMASLLSWIAVDPILAVCRSSFICSSQSPENASSVPSHRDTCPDSRQFARRWTSSRTTVICALIPSVLLSSIVEKSMLFWLHHTPPEENLSVGVFRVAWFLSLIDERPGGAEKEIFHAS